MVYTINSVRQNKSDFIYIYIYRLYYSPIFYCLPLTHLLIVQESVLDGALVGIIGCPAHPPLEVSLPLLQLALHRSLVRGEIVW